MTPSSSSNAALDLAQIETTLGGVNRISFADPARLRHDDSPPEHVRWLRTLGSGRAATAELVEASWADGRRKRYVEKVFAPGLLTRWIYRIAFAAPFAYQSNQHAIHASFYRRRVASELLDAQAICGGVPSRVDVALPAYVRFDQARKAWVLAAEFIEGRGPIPCAFADKDSQVADEMSDLIGQMRQVESQLIQWGLVGSGWQVSPGAWVSTANLLIPAHPKLQLFTAHGETAKSASAKSRYTIIDLESGIPAVLLWRYLKLSWSRGSLFPFDDLDPERLKVASDKIADQIAQHGQPVRAANLRRDVSALIAEDRLWKASELAPFRKPWTWLRSERRSVYRQDCINRWHQRGSIDVQMAADLTSGFWPYFLLWLIGAFFHGSLGRWLQAMVGNQQHQRRVQRFVKESRCRKVFWERYRSVRTRRWMRQQRCSRDSRPVSRTGFLTHRLLGGLTPAPVHRYLVDPLRRDRRNRQAWAFLTRGSFQAAWGRKIFGSILARWRSRDWLSASQAMDLRSQFNGPRMAAYSRGLTIHLAIKLLYPLMAPLKAGGIAVTLAGGSLWYTMIPLMLLPLLRTVVTLSSMWLHRTQKIPHGHALCIGAVPTFGSAAFAVQMWTVNQKISVLLLRDTASRLARKIPVYGGPDSRTEHAIIASADRLIDCATRVAANLSKYRNAMTIQPESNDSIRSPSAYSLKRLWWPYPNVIRDSVVLVAVCFSGLWSIDRWGAGARVDRWLTGENGALETVQLLALVATVIVAIVSLTRTTASSWRTVGIALACIAFVGAIREIPAFDSPAIIDSGVLKANSAQRFTVPRYGKHMVILFASLIFFARGAYAWFAYPADRRRWFSPSFIWPVVPFATCFVVAEVFERAGWAMAEESVELLAYSMMLAAAVWVTKNAEQLNQAELAIKHSVHHEASSRRCTTSSDQHTEDNQQAKAA